MCNSETCASVVGYYITISAQVCEPELRKLPLLSQQHQPVACEEMADYRLLLAVDRFFAGRHLQISNKIAEISDEQNRYNSITPEQEKQLDLLLKSLAQIQKLQDFSRSFSADAVDDNLKPLLQVVFFIFLTHCESLREVVCMKRTRYRLQQHSAFARLFGTVDFFAGLVELTKQYIAFELNEKQYVTRTRRLLRTGTTLDV